MTVRSRSRLASCVLLTALLLAGLAPRPAAAATLSWQPFSPSGLSIQLLKTDPAAPGTLYIATYRGGLFKSTNGGRTWSWSGRGLEGEDVQALVTDPSRPGALYALSGRSSVFGSTDNGATWRRLGGLVPEDGLFSGQDLVIDAARTLYLAASRELFASTDLGATWKRILQTEFSIQSVAADPGATGTVYVATYGGSSGGAIIPVQIFKTGDGGLNWQNITGDVIPDLGDRPSFSSVILGVASTNPATVYAAVSFHGIFQSTSGSATWRRLPLGNAEEISLTALTFDAADPRTVYVAHGPLREPHVAVSHDAGETWQSRDRGLSAYHVNHLAADSSTDTLFAADIFSGLRFSTAGRPWRSLIHSVAEANFDPSPGKVRFRPGDPSTVYTLIAGRYWKSTDAAKTWTAFSISPGSPFLNDLAFDSADPDTLYGTARTGVFRSDDGGKSWVLLRKGTASAVLPHLGTILAGGCGITRSTDGGATWRQVLSCQAPGLLLGRSVIKLWTDPKDTDEIYAMTEELTRSSAARHVYRSKDGGATWRRLISEIDALVLDPHRPETLYAARDNELIKSTDDGRTWRRIGVIEDLLLLGKVSDLVFDPADPSTLYATTLLGLLHSRDGGRTWARVTLDPLSFFPTLALYPHPKEPHLFYGAAPYGIYEARIEP
jgi:photosystem II stability/assembly factor-like uncharacterized protein